MDTNQLKDQIYAAFEGRKGEYELIKASVEKFIMSVLGDAKGVVIETPELIDAVKLLVSIIDDYTSSGIFEAIDAPMANMLFGKIIDKNEKMKIWYSGLRKTILDAAAGSNI